MYFFIFASCEPLMPVGMCVLNITSIMNIMFKVICWTSHIYTHTYFRLKGYWGLEIHIPIWTLCLWNLRWLKVTHAVFWSNQLRDFAQHHMISKLYDSKLYIIMNSLPKKKSINIMRWCTAEDRTCSLFCATSCAISHSTKKLKQCVLVLLRYLVKNYFVSMNREDPYRCTIEARTSPKTMYY